MCFKLEKTPWAFHIIHSIRKRENCSFQVSRGSQKTPVCWRWKSAGCYTKPTRGSPSIWMWYHGACHMLNRTSQEKLSGNCMNLVSLDRLCFYTMNWLSMIFTIQILTSWLFQMDPVVFINPILGANAD